ncbi:SDR family oxidoreductase [Variovorax sp. Sphag1AA]|uniref:SDR family oxidoreductase n=1 Tax=Variovorax sp. Sphag1AA TaxID=2587027 RepID=UPI00160D4E4A|nr:SDR family oxidoreductase [Variovorax sp. Sphag1AA]
MLADKVILVTGAGGGIGRHIALHAAREGASVVVNDLGSTVGGDGRDAARAAQVAADIESAGGRAVANTDSVTDWEAAQRMVQSAVGTFGRLDAVINNAGILRDRIFHQLGVDEFDAVVKVHLYGAFHLSRAAASLFRAQGSGALVHMTSTSGLIGNLGQANYAAAKLGIVGLSRSISLDMARFNVRSNCIAPTAFSRMIESIPGQSAEEQARFREKLKATVRADQVAPLAVFLASDAACEVSGQVFGVRGNEVYLYSQPRPVRTMHCDAGWSPRRLAEQMLPAFRPSLTPLDRARDVFAWDAV